MTEIVSKSTEKGLETQKEESQKIQKELSSVDLDVLSTDTYPQKYIYSNENLSKKIKKVETISTTSFYEIKELKKGNDFVKFENIKFENRQAEMNIGLGDLMPPEVKKIKVWNRAGTFLGSAQRKSLSGGFYYNKGAGRYAKILKGYSFEVEEIEENVKEKISQHKEIFDAQHKEKYEDIEHEKVITIQEKEIEEKEIIYQMASRYDIDPLFILAFRKQCIERGDDLGFGISFPYAQDYANQINMFCRKLQHTINRVATSKDKNGKLTIAFIKSFSQKYIQDKYRKNNFINGVLEKYGQYSEKKFNLQEVKNVFVKKINPSKGVSQNINIRNSQNRQKEKEIVRFPRLNEEEIIRRINEIKKDSFLGLGLFPQKAKTIEEALEKAQEYLEEEKSNIPALKNKIESLEKEIQHINHLKKKYEDLRDRENASSKEIYLAEEYEKYRQKKHILREEKLSGYKFFENAKFLAQRIEELFGIPWKVTVSQTLLETGHGKSQLNKNDNNYFGIKGRGNVYMTREVYNGKSFKIRDSFRSYNGIEKSFYDYARLLTSSRYAPVLERFKKGEITSSYEYLNQIWKAGYATALNYTESANGALEVYGESLKDSIHFSEKKLLQPQINHSEALEKAKNNFQGALAQRKRRRIGRSLESQYQEQNEERRNEIKELQDLLTQYEEVENLKKQAERIRDEKEQKKEQLKYKIEKEVLRRAGVWVKEKQAKDPSYFKNKSFQVVRKSNEVLPPPGFVFPATGNLVGGNTSHYGYNRRDENGNIRLHAGVDVYARNDSGRLIAGKSAKVYAVRRSKVIKNQWHSGYGYTIDLQDLENGYVYRYAHIAHNPDLKIGQTVQAGEVLSYINGSGTDYGNFAELFRGDHEQAIQNLNKKGWGNTSKPHLHFEVRKTPNTFYANSAMDPQKVFGRSMTLSGKSLWMSGGRPSVDPRTLIPKEDLARIESKVKEEMYATL